MEWSIIGTGIAIGLAVAAPIGPINLLCIQRSLQLGFLAGLTTGVGAVLGDGLFAVVSAFGITWIADLITGNRVWLQSIGGVALVIMGLKTMVARPAAAPASLNRKWLHHGGLIGTTFLLTVTNPATLFGFVVIFSGLTGLMTLAGDGLKTAQLVGAVMAGSFLWWLVLSRAASHFKSRISERGLTLINRISGFVILAFGVAVLADVLTKNLL